MTLQRVVAAWVVASVVSVGCAVPPAPPSNLLENPGFEDGVTSPDHWEVDEFQPAVTTWDDTVAHGGARSVKVEAASPNDVRWVQRNIPVQPDTQYRLAGWIKTENVAHSSPIDAGANLSLFGTWTRSDGVFGTNDWTYREFTFNSSSSTQIDIAVRVGYWSGTTTGTAWFDDLELTEIEGVERHVVASMTPAEMANAESEARAFIETDIPLLTSGNMVPTVTVRYPTRTLDQLTPQGSGFWPAPADTQPERDPAFDAVMVIWDPRATDVDTGESIWIGSAAGLTPGMGTDQTYFAMIIEATTYGHRNVFKHEFGHSILDYFEALGATPLPTIANHAQSGDYVHCPTGAPYVWVDETTANPIPNSIYNNESGFTHDYYSGTIALPGDPTTCLGIGPTAWAQGGPVTGPQPHWDILVLIYEHTDFTYTDYS